MMTTNSDLDHFIFFSVLFISSGEGHLAAAHYREAIQLKPEHYVAMVNLGRLLRSFNENKEAESWYKRYDLYTLQKKNQKNLSKINKFCIVSVIS